MALASTLKTIIQARLPWTGFAGNQPAVDVLGNKDFRLFLFSEFVGVFGSHFYQIAWPWLAMKISGGPAALGTAIFLSGISRAGLMMVGGALSDRFSPRSMILLANIIRASILAVFIGLMVLGCLNLTTLYLLSFASGLPDALSIPAHGAIMPLLVKKEQLKVANSIAASQGTAWALIGPALAGLSIAWLNQTICSPEIETRSLGAAAAFGINLVAIVLSTMLFWPVRLTAGPLKNSKEETVRKPINLSTVPSMVKELLWVIRSQASLRLSFLMVYGINVLSSAPLYIGMPMLAVSRFSQGPQALGFLTSALGLGALLGTLLAGLLPQPVQRQIGKIFVFSVVGLASGIGMLFSAPTLTIAAAAVLILAVLINYVNVVGVTQIQRDAPPELLGRMMGLLNTK